MSIYWAVFRPEGVKMLKCKTLLNLNIATTCFNIIGTMHKNNLYNTIHIYLVLINQFIITLLNKIVHMPIVLPYGQLYYIFINSQRCNITIKKFNQNTVRKQNVEAKWMVDKAIDDFLQKLSNLIFNHIVFLDSIQPLG